MSDFNPVDANPKLRSALYLLQWVFNLALGVLGIIFTATKGIDDMPQWYVISGLVATFVWTYTGIMAKSHVDNSTP